MTLFERSNPRPTTHSDGQTADQRQALNEPWTIGTTLAYYGRSVLGF